MLLPLVRLILAFVLRLMSLPTVIALATLEGLTLTFVLRRAYDWRSWAASATDALVREYLVYAFVGVSGGRAILRACRVQ